MSGNSTPHIPVHVPRLIAAPFSVALMAFAAWVAGDTPATPPPLRNLVVNGDFEKGEGGYPLEWAFKDQKGNLSESKYAEAFFHEERGGKVGDRCVLFKSADGLVYIQQNIQAIVAKGDKYKISAYVKTENMSGKVRMTVTPGKGWIKHWADKTVEKPTQDWTLVEQTFSPTEDDNGLGIRILSGINDGKAWIDGVSLELVAKGETVAATLESAGKAKPVNTSAATGEQRKIAIGGFSPLGERGLFWEKEPLQFQINGTNNTGEQQEFEVAFVVKDFFGTQVKESKTSFTTQAKSRFSQTIDLGTTEGKFGFFSVKASVRQKDAVIDQMGTGCCVLRPPNAETDNFFSANSNGGCDSYLVNAMRRIGVTSRGVNFKLSWVPESKRNDFDAYLSNEIENGRYKAFWCSELRLIGHICEDGSRDFRSFEPSWYAAVMEERKKRGEFPYPEEYFKEYGDFVEAVGRRAHNRIKVWLVEEEIDATLYNCPDKRTQDWGAERYIQRVKIANERLKKVDPNCMVVALAASCTDVNPPPPYWRMAKERLLPSIKGHFDMIGPDAYCGQWNLSRDNIETAASERQDLRGVLLATVELQKSLQSKTENIAISEKGWGIPYHYEPDDEAVRKIAYYAARYFIIAKSVPQTSYVSIWTMSSGALHAINTRKMPSTDASPVLDSGFWKTIRTKNTDELQFYPRSWAAVVATMDRLLSHAANPTELNVRKGFYSYAFQKKDQAITAVWTIEKQPYQIVLSLPAKSAYCDVMGNMRELPEGRTELTVSECPFFLISKTSINDVAAMMNKADFPTKALLDAEAHVTDASTVSVFLQNKTSQPMTADVTIDPIASISMSELKKEVAIPASGKVAADFAMRGADPAKLNGMKITGKVNARNRMIPISETIELIPIQEMKVPVTIDGNLAKYAQIKPIILGKENIMTPIEYAANSIDLWRNNDNLSATFYLAWDANNFYIAGEVTDDIHLQRKSGSDIWMDDCVQFAFDTKNDAMKSDDAEKKDFDGNDYNFGMALTRKGPLCWCWLEKGELTKRFEGTRKYPLAIKREETKTTYELAIPWQNLAPLEPKPGKVFRFNFVVFDIDSDNQARAKYWLGLTPGIAGGNDPSAFKTFMLVGDR